MTKIIRTLIKTKHQEVEYIPIHCRANEQGYTDTGTNVKRDKSIVEQIESLSNY